MEKILKVLHKKIAQEKDAGATFDFKIKNDGTGKPTEIEKRIPSTSEVLRKGFEEEQAARKKKKKKKTKKKKLVNF